MGAFTGAFYGYREQDIILPRSPGIRPEGSISPMKLSPALMEAMGIPGYDYFARNGDAPVDFAADWIRLPWTCRMAKWTLRGGPLEIQVSFDGEVIGDQRVLRASTQTLDSFIGYRVRQLVPGFLVWYQLVAII